MLQAKKLKILLRTFSVPIFWTFILILKINFPDFSVSKFFSFGFSLGFFIGSTIGLFFKDEKYLTEIQSDDNNASLKYLTQFASERKLNIRLDKIIKTKLKSKVFLIRDFETLTFYNQTSEIKFNILTDDLKQEVIDINKRFLKPEYRTELTQIKSKDI